MWFALRLLAVVIATLVAVAVRRLLGRRGHPDWTWRTECLARVAQWCARRAITAPLERVRAAMPDAPVPRALRRHVAIERSMLGGVGVEQTTPSSWTPSDGTLLYLHGGGYVLCSPGTHREIVARLAVASGARVVSVDYRLAPEHPFPSPVQDAWSAYLALLASGVEPARLALGGDSAGGGLCLAVAQRARDEGRPRPAALVLLSPWVDLAIQGESYVDNERFDYLSRELSLQCARRYLGDAEPREPWASALYAELADLPPMLVHSGALEVFRAEHEQLVARARESGVQVEHRIAPGMVHAWHGFATFLPEGRRALAEAGQYLRRTIGAGAPPPGTPTVVVEALPTPR